MDEFCIGIDLGTSNSAVALSESLDQTPLVVAVPQVTAVGAIGDITVLPSALYLPMEGEPTDAALPWGGSSDSVIGAWARERGAQAPERLVASAKSWLCNPFVDRKAKILPWKSQTVGEKISPVDASRRYLEHLKLAFEYQQGQSAKTVNWENSRTVLTVPASFDEVARGLTHEAAVAAGLGKVVLLEEPQAALYAWIAQTQGEWRKQLRPGDIVLVVDVGGGTTDFSLIAVSEEQGNLRLERISVGEHLLLGGDNMDLTLAYFVKAQLEAQGKKLDHWQVLSLVHSARLAKEKLFTEQELEEVPISVASRGSSLFKQTLSSRLSRSQLLSLVLDGFFPLSEATEMPVQRRSVGIQDYGLPYVADPAISKHLARFLTRSLENVTSDSHLRALVGKASDGLSFVRPSAVLFNGGVFNAPQLRARVMEVLGRWADQPVRELSGAHYDLAVAKGASYYARTLAEDKGVRIKAGTARSYYLGVEPSMPAIPGYQPPIMGLCVVPQGIEEGSELVLAEREFGLVTGEPVEFRFFSSSVRAGDKVGVVVEDAPAELEETSRLQITLPPLHGQSGEIVPVNLDALVTEVGTLELRMQHTQSDRKWNLQFNVRPQSTGEAVPESASPCEPPQSEPAPLSPKTRGTAGTRSRRAEL